MKTVITVWEVRTYDVWGNRKDGWDVNNSFRVETAYQIRCKVNTYNAGTEREFISAHPSDYALQRLFGTRAKLTTDGDDMAIYVRRESDDYPIGELHCTSHASLSPIR